MIAILQKGRLRLEVTDRRGANNINLSKGLVKPFSSADRAVIFLDFALVIQYEKNDVKKPPPGGKSKPGRPPHSGIFDGPGFFT
jgi:hypothetical protein